MMCNKRILTAKMLLAGRQYFVKDLANDLQISPGSASLKLNGRAPFRRDEMLTLCKLYHLNTTEFLRTFFPELVIKESE